MQVFGNGPERNGSRRNVWLTQSRRRTVDRREAPVLLLLVIWIVRERDASAAEQIARMLPANHAAVKWALVGAKGKIDDTALDDLGDPISVEQVLWFMRPKEKKKW